MDLNNVKRDDCYDETLLKILKNIQSTLILKDHPDLIEECIQYLSAQIFRKISFGHIVSHIGILGPASNGKTLLFNSLIGQKIGEENIISNSTKGPIAYVPKNWFDELQKMETVADRHLWLPFLERKICSSEDASSLSGSNKELLIVLHNNPIWEDKILMDTPDMSSFKSQDDGDIALKLLPWLHQCMVLGKFETYQEEKVHSLIRKIQNDINIPLALIYNQLGSAGEGSEEVSLKALNKWKPSMSLFLPVLDDDTYLFNDSILKPIKESFFKLEPNSSSDAIDKMLKSNLENLSDNCAKRRALLNDCHDDLNRIISKSLKTDFKPKREWFLTQKGEDLAMNSKWHSFYWKPIGGIYHKMKMRFGVLPKPGDFTYIPGINDLYRTESESREMILKYLQPTLGAIHEKICRSASKSKFTMKYLNSDWNAPRVVIDIDKLEDDLKVAIEEFRKKINDLFKAIIKSKENTSSGNFYGSRGQASLPVFLIIDYFCFGGIGTLSYTAGVGAFSFFAGPLVDLVVDIFKKKNIKKMDGKFGEIFELVLNKMSGAIYEKMMTESIRPDLASEVNKIEDIQNKNWELTALPYPWGEL